MVLMPGRARRFPANFVDGSPARLMSGFGRCDAC
jgi:hypothetical protein